MLAHLIPDFFFDLMRTLRIRPDDRANPANVRVYLID